MASTILTMLLVFNNKYMRGTKCATIGLEEGTQFFLEKLNFQDYLFKFNLHQVTNLQTFTQNQNKSPPYCGSGSVVGCFGTFFLFVFPKAGYHYYFKYVKGSTEKYLAYSM